MIFLKLPLFTMNRFSRIVACPNLLLKLKFRRFCDSVGNLPKVKIVKSEIEDNMKISFRYGNYAHNGLNVVVQKQEELHSVLSRIKQAISLQVQREELRRSVINKYCRYSVSESVLDCDDNGEDVDICLIQNDQLLKSSVPNIEAWTPGTFLKIGQYMYEVDVDNPAVIALSLPNTILAGCIIRPHFIFEHADVRQSSFFWYHSASEEEVEDLDSENVLKVEKQWWIKVSEGFMYWTTKNDLGRRLRLVCIPKLDQQSGQKFAAESTDVVRKGPENFPFEERHLYTKELTSADSIRCLSYNILANMYVETRKFPYCSRVAKDIYYRKQLLLRELIGYNSDILCLQEVQGRIFEYDILPVLQETGFDGYHTRKGGKRNEGLACFFRTSKFNVISQEGVLLNEIIKKKDIFCDLLTKVSGNFKDLSKLLIQHSALQIVLLEHVDNPKRRILVANTHLYSNKHTPEVRLLQSALCVYYIEHVLKTQAEAGPTALLFCGDFNSLPNSFVLEFLLQGFFECCSSWNKSASGATIDSTLRHDLSLDSACGFPAYTNYTDEFNGCLDYIFYNKNFFTISDVVPFPSHESVIQKVGLPSELFPSDHIPLICTLKWK